MLYVSDTNYSNYKFAEDTTAFSEKSTELKVLFYEE